MSCASAWDFGKYKMAQGLQIFDGNGTILVDTSTGFTWLGVYTIPLNVNSGSISVPEFGLPNVQPWWYFVRPYSASYSVRNLIFGASGTNLNWTSGGSGGTSPNVVNGYVVYGIR